MLWHNSNDIQICQYKVKYKLLINQLCINSLRNRSFGVQLYEVDYRVCYYGLPGPAQPPPQTFSIYATDYGYTALI